MYVLSLHVALEKQCVKKLGAFVYVCETVSEVVSELRAMQPGADDFELRAVVGRGRYGEVQVVREKATGDVCALKVMDKEVLRSQGNVSN